MVAPIGCTWAQKNTNSDNSGMHGVMHRNTTKKKYWKDLVESNSFVEWPVSVVVDGRPAIHSPQRQKALANDTDGDVTAETSLVTSFLIDFGGVCFEASVELTW